MVEPAESDPGAGNLLRTRWIGASALGMVIPVALVPSLNEVLTFEAMPLITIVTATLGGLLVGVAQWRILRRLIPNSRIWLLVTPGGWFLSALLGVFINSIQIPADPNYVWMLLWTGITGGALVGLLQWFFLWEQSTAGWWWPPASAIGTIGGTLLGLALSLPVILFFAFRPAPMGNFVSYLIGGGLIGAIAGAVYGAATSLVLKKILPAR